MGWTAQLKERIDVTFDQIDDDPDSIFGSTLESEISHQIFGSTITLMGCQRWLEWGKWECGYLYPDEYTYCESSVGRLWKPGTRVLELDFTSNYGEHFRKVLGKGGIQNIYALSGREAMPLLEKAARKLKDDFSDNHWEPTEGNAKRVLLQLACLSCMAPDGVWWIHH